MNTDAQAVVTLATEQDPTSLRAAALLTLKSKRRKVQKDIPAFPLPSRPLPEASFQLDYGQDEPPNTSRQPPSPIKLENRISTAPESPSQAREEGEISDDEQVTQPPAVREKRPSASSLYQPNVDTTTPRHTTPDPPTRSISQTYPKLFDRLSDPPSVSDYVPSEYSSMSELGHTELSPTLRSPLQPSVLITDGNQQRPGLQLNQSQYERAKDLILDLLGWGVAPEYLVDCGVSKATVFYVFSDLNLRLPQNLDLQGSASHTQSDTLSSPSTQATESPSVYSKSSVQDIEASSPDVLHVASASQVSSILPAEVPSEPVPALVPDIPISDAASDLHDMERQRRQELLARKAAVASRKSKQASTPTSPPQSPVASPSGSSTLSGNAQDVEMAVFETVDNFLKTISPPSTSKTGDIELSPPPQAMRSGNEDMDVDEAPRPGGVDRVSTTISDQVSSGDTSISPAESSASAFTEEPPPSSTESVSMNLSTQSSHPFDFSALPEAPALQRRGSKRPVAADFVDFDSSTRPSSSSSNAYASGANTGSRRKAGTGFASVISARRFIIDLSDSEGEGDEDGDMHEAPRPIARHTHKLVTKPSLNISSGRSTPIVPVPTPTVPTTSVAANTNVTPSALAEKEMEIKKMRELIAERERRRLEKKLKANTEATIGNQKTSMGKQEDPSTTGVGVEGVEDGRNAQLEDRRYAKSSMTTTPTASSSSSGSPTTDMTPHDTVSQPDPNRQVSSAEVKQKHVVSLGIQGRKTSGLVDVDLAASASTQEATTSTSTSTSPAHPKPVENPAGWGDWGVARDDDYFMAYESPLKLYPLIGSRARPLYSKDVQEPILALESLFSDSSLSSFSTSLSNLFSSSSSVGGTSVSPSHIDIPTSILPSSSSSPSPSSSLFSSSSRILGPLNLGVALRKLDPSKRICQYEVPGGGVCRDEGCEDVHLGRIPGVDGEPSDEEDIVEYLVKDVLGPNWLVSHGMTVSKLILALKQGQQAVSRLNRELIIL